MELYAAFDVHSRSSYLGVIDADGHRVLGRKVRNGPPLVLEALRSVKADVVGVVVESTYNWYWIVDTLMEDGYQVHLANVSQINKYKALKYIDDRHDAFWLAEMLRLKILPEGYIYPKEDRSVRDLLRKRSHLVRLRTSLILGLENIFTRNLGLTPNLSDIKAVSEDRVTPLLEGDEYLCLAGRVSKESIDYLTRQIHTIERAVLSRVCLTDEYKNLNTIPGIGEVLAITIMLESGPMARFTKAGNYVSYCRKVPTEWLSNGKRKGKGNKKNGNKYLAWAFSEAAVLARRLDPKARRYYNRKLSRTNPAVAHSALAHKLARAAYYVMRDQVAFVPQKAFGWDGEPAAALASSLGA
jgi:transposase